MWISRQPGIRSSYALWAKKPKYYLHSGSYWVESSFVAEFCPDNFERFTDLRLQPGECVQIEGKIHFELKK